MKRYYLLAALTALIITTTFAQQPKGSVAQTKPSQNEDPVRLSVTLVQMDVMVLDKNGRLVTDLKKEDFEILENGRPQQITNFSYISAEPASAPAVAATRPVDPNAPPVPTARLRPDQVKRTIVLLVDDLGMSFESMHDVRGALKKFVDEQMQPGDLVAIIRTGEGMGALQQFTSDKRLLLAAIERVRWSPTGFNTVSAVQPLGQTDSLRVQSETVEDPDADRESLVFEGRIGALDLILRGLSEIPGRKSVILFSDGLPLFGETGASPGENEVGSIVRGKDRRVLDAAHRLADLANRASVVIYTVDSRGLQALGGAAADAVDAPPRGFRTGEFRRNQDGLNFIADETGGFFMHDLGDLSHAVRRVLDDQKGYYLIGYIPDENTFKPAGGRKQYNKVEVKVKRAGLKVRSRKGFYGVPERESPPTQRTPGQKLLAALTSPFDSGDIGLRLTSLFGHDKQEGSFVRSLLHISAGDLTFIEEADGQRKAAINLVAVTYGGDGEIVDQVGKSYTIRARDESLERLKKDGFIYEVTVPAKKAGGYQLRVAVQDAASQRIGSANQFIEVPDVNKDRLALSGIVISGKDLSKTNKTEEVREPQASPAVRRFRRGMQLAYTFIVYNAQLDRETRRPQLEKQIVLYRDGKPVYTGQARPIDPGQQSDPKRIAASGTVNLGTDLGPGQYVMQVKVTDKLAKRKYATVTRWIDFDLPE